MLVKCVLICFSFFFHFKADKIKGSIVKKPLSTYNLLSFKIQLIPRPLRKWHSRHKTLLLLKKLIKISAYRGRKLPTLDENEKFDQKKNIEPKPKQTKLSSFFLKINWIMLNYVSFVVTQIFLFLSGTFSFLVCLYIDICV